MILSPDAKAKTKDRLFKVLSVLSFILGAYWLSEMGQPVLHCHTSPQLLGIISSSETDSKKLGDSWLQCAWWDYLLPRPSLTSRELEQFVSWQIQATQLQKLEKILPSLKAPILVIQNKKEPFAYQVTERRLVLGEQVLNSEPLLLRAMVQAWIYQADLSGLDTFQTEVLTDFLLVNFLDVPEYQHPLSGFSVSLTQTRYWPEEAMGFSDYCLSEQASLQHISLCRELIQTLSAPQKLPSLWSARLYAVHLLNEQWKTLSTEQHWQKLIQIPIALKTKIQVTNTLAKNEPQSISQVLDSEMLLLKKILGLDFKISPTDLAVTHLIDWQAGELSEDFLNHVAFGEIDPTARARVWLRYKNEFWDLRGRKKLKFETSDYHYNHIIRVQCQSGGLKDPFLLNTKELTIIHHCQPVDREWDVLFQGKIKRFLKSQKDLAYLKLRPQEFKRYLQWHPEQATQTWDYSQWKLWLHRFGVEAGDSTLKASGVWEVIEEYRLKPLLAAKSTSRHEAATAN